MTITSIALEKLVVSPQNVRKTLSKSGMEELKASILAHGLLNNLVVTQAQKGVYYVVAGARRLAAMQDLQKEGKLPKNHSVACRLQDDHDASEASLAENTVREAMNPADEFEAFAALTKDHPPEEIAARFGITTRHVQQRLRLARVAPELMKAYRAGTLDLDALMSFTLSDDHNHQRKVFKAVGENPSSNYIRRLMTEKTESSKDKLCRFVTLKAYVDAGGKTRDDLFTTETFLENPALLHDLATKRLKCIEEALKSEGWAWVTVALENEYGFTHKYGRLQPKSAQPPKELVTKHAKLAKECEKLENDLQDMDFSSPRYAELDAKSDELVLQLEAVETELATYQKYEAEQMKTAGVYARLDSEGKLLIDRGLVSRATEKKLEAAKSGKKTKPDEKAMSQSLRLSIEAYRLQVAEVAIASSPELAYDLLVFSAAVSLLAGQWNVDGVDVTFRNKTPIMGDVKNTPAAKTLASLKEKLSLKWLDLDEETEQFEALRKLTNVQKSYILAHCVALTLEPFLAPEPDADISAYDKALVLTGADVAALWRPTADNYLGRITRVQLLTLGREIFSKAWAEKWAAAKKGDLVKELDRAFADPKKFAGNPETEQRLRTWLPEGMAFTLPDKKAAKSKKKAA